VNKYPFVHLHFHTAYSLLDGACAVGPSMRTAEELGMPALAMTDHGVLYGAVEFYSKAVEQGIKPILGCEAYIARGDMRARGQQESRENNHLVLLAETDEGYANLIRLISLAHLEGFYYKPRIDKELLSLHSAGLIGLSSCLKGEVASRIIAGDNDGAVNAAGEYADIFGKDNFFLEMEDHGIREQKTVNQAMPEISRRTGLPLVATNDVHYLRKEHAAAHDIMLCLQTQTVVSNPRRMRYASQEFYMKSGAEMWRLFGDFPEALENTVRIAERCNVEIPLGRELHFPVYRVPDGYTQKSYLLQLAREGLRDRYGITDPDHPRNEYERTVCERFAYELSIIEKTGFINYFLVVSDFVRYAREHNIPVGPGRGSGAGSLVAYALGITGIDPLRYNLIFERFLNPERVSPPDFDIDFCQSRREEVIEYVKRKYGRENVAQIITFGTLGAKTLIRDIGRVLEIPFAECDRLAKMIPEDPNMTLEKALELSPEFRRAVEKDENARRIMEYARVLEGLPRHAGTHAAGVVIGERPLIELVPLSRDKDRNIITQFEMKPLEKTGLLKMDFLGLKTLTVIQEALDNIEQFRGTHLDIEKIPMDDQSTFDLLNRGDTVGVFQVESRGMRDLLRRIGLSTFEDLIAMIALFRPGPMNMLDDYINRKHGKVPITYDHPLLEPILKETYGVMLYQEQVQQAANVLAGFSLGQGDILRRAMGKKRREEMMAQRERFVQGCMQTNKIPRAKAEHIFDNIERFAGYGFNKSHSAAYAILSYRTAYLKAHYPVEFMSAILSSEIGNTDKLPILISEAQEMGIAVLPPNVNESHVRFRPAYTRQASKNEDRAPDAIRFGMAGVKNVGTSAVEAILRERDAGGPFQGLLDFCVRMDSQLVNRKVIESLIKCGAFDFTGISRGRLFKNIDYALNRAAAVQRDRRTGQQSLFETSTSAPDDHDLPAGEPWTTSEMLSAEHELIGFYISGHPLKEYEWTLKNFALTRIAEIDGVPAGSPTRVGGLVSRLAKKSTRSKETMATFRLEGLEGAVDVIVFPKVLSEYGVFLRNEAPVIVCGEVVHEDRVRIRAREIYPLSEAPKLFAVRIFLNTPATALEEGKLAKLKEIFGRHSGTIPLLICIEFPTGEKIFTDTGRHYHLTPSEQMVRDIEHTIGEGSVYIETLATPCRTNSTKRKSGRNARPR